MNIFENHKFGGGTLSAVQLHLANLAVSDVNKYIKNYESYLMEFKNGYCFWENGGIVFIKLGTRTRPIIQSLIAIESLSNKYYIPSIKTEDLMDLSKIFGFCDLRRQVGMYLFSILDKGVYEKHELPYEITTQDELDRLEIKSRVDLARHHEQGETVWWNRWGGIVFVIRLKQDGMIFYEEISWRKGKYKKRWFYPEY